MPRGVNKVPIGWEKYSPIGRPIDGTRFLCFKTPLSDNFHNRLSDKDRWFTTHHLLLSVAGLRGKLGLVVDLTDTQRYYDPGELTVTGIEYRKLNCPGHDVDQRDDLVYQFYDIVDDYKKQFAGDELFIGVHCTHGVNRSGYLVCRYLIDRAGWTAERAIEAFAKARGYPIERENYLDALRLADRRAQRRAAASVADAAAPAAAVDKPYVHPHSPSPAAAPVASGPTAYDSGDDDWLNPGDLDDFISPIAPS